MANSTHYDLIVIGGGPGGYVAAIRAAQLGKKVAIIEKDKTLGGTCLNVGCIPSKALLSSTEHYHFAKERFAAHGIQTKGLSMDVSVMMKRKEQVVGQLTKGVDFLMKKNKIDRHLGFGRLKNGKTVELLDGKDGKVTATLTADAIILATGSVPIELPFLKFDGQRVVSSDQAIAFTEVPKKLIVIGGGVIGLELGSVWARLGSEVTVVEFLPRIAAGVDGQTAAELQRALEKQGLTIHCNTKVESAKVGAKGVTLQAARDGQSVSYEADIVLVAVGRKPYTDGLGLDHAGIKLTDRGRIAVEKNWRTSAPGVYAIGDVVDGPMLAHKAEDEGVAVAEVIATGHGHVNYDAIPNVIYTSPEVASVGATEEQLKERGVEYRSGKFSFQANGRAIAGDVTTGFAKVLADAKTDRLLGAHILGHNASELIAEAALLMEFGGSAEDLGRTCHAHPTMSEALKEAALAANGRVISS